MNTGRFNLEEAQDHLYGQELNNHKEHIPETEEYGITSFVYRARELFIPEKIHAFFYQEWPGVVRSKGFFWISTRPEFVGELSQAGPLVRHQGMGAVVVCCATKSVGQMMKISSGWSMKIGTTSLVTAGKKLSLLV